MAGQLHDEVLTYARWLRAAGLSRNAIDALSVIAEGCRLDGPRGPRTGSVARGRIADKLCATERTADRALRELRDHGLVTVVQRAGGRGRSGLVAVYQMASLRAWFSADPCDTDVSHPSPDPTESVRHPDVAPMAPGDPARADPCDKSGQSMRHLGVAPPVVPVRTPGGTTEATTRPHADPTPPPDHPPAPASGRPGAPGARSRCGRPDCRAPRPCGACGRARRADQAAEQRAAAEVRNRQAQDRARQLEERRVALATCPNACDDGYLPGGWVCDHQPRPARQDGPLPGHLEALAVAAAVARSARRKAQTPATTGDRRRARRRRPALTRRAAS